MVRIRGRLFDAASQQDQSHVPGHQGLDKALMSMIQCNMSAACTSLCIITVITAAVLSVVIDLTGSSTSSSDQPRAHRFLQSTRTLQHRESLGAANGSSDSSLPSQKSGVKFGRAARVAALGVAATPPASQPQASQKGILYSNCSMQVARLHAAAQVCSERTIPHTCTNQ